MKRKIAVVGLGYVGLPVAVAFGEKYPVIGFDINEGRIGTLKKGIDYTNEVEEEKLKKASIEFTSDASRLQAANFIIVSVPTPIDAHNQPNLLPLLKASETIGANIRKGTIIVYESTVFPGATEDNCVPVLEKASGLVCGRDFFIGYSPERINPGDKINTFTNIVKVVSGQTPEILEIIAEVYSSVVSAGVYKAGSIKVAESAKVIENIQRDVNIALMNELALIFDHVGVDTAEVLEAAGTKWNFLGFSPGLVGGHCIGVDPYYLTHKAQMVGLHPEVILASRRTNNGVSKFIAQTVIKKLIKHNIEVQKSTVTVLGLTFKENVPDLRNTKVIDIIRELEEFGVKVQVNDVEVKELDVSLEPSIELLPLEKLKKSDAVILAVPHFKYIESGWDLIQELLKDDAEIIVDIKSVLDVQKKPKKMDLWRL